MKSKDHDTQHKKVRWCINPPEEKKETSLTHSERTKTARCIRITLYIGGTLLKSEQRKKERPVLHLTDHVKTFGIEAEFAGLI